MTDLSYTLLSDGSSDRRLMPLLTWVLQCHCPRIPIKSRWADLFRLPQRPRTLYEKIIAAIDLYPCNLLFIHRDAENQPYSVRREEIEKVIAKISDAGTAIPAIYVIPVRMQESWLLFSEDAIRRAAGNPKGRITLTLPVLAQIESITNPKETLHELLKRASELSGRRLKRFEVSRSSHLITQYIDDYSPLRTLTAFRHFEADVKQFLTQNSFN
jgi:hypothetical protein